MATYKRKLWMQWTRTNYLMTDIEKLFAATRYRVKKDPSVPKTCQTCKHWVANKARTGKSLSTSMGKCKEIFENLTTFDSELEGYIPHFEFFITRATFGCNGYEQDGNL